MEHCVAVEGVTERVMEGDERVERDGSAGPSGLVVQGLPSGPDARDGPVAFLVDLDRGHVGDVDLDSPLRRDDPSMGREDRRPHVDADVAILRHGELAADVVVVLCGEAQADRALLSVCHTHEFLDVGVRLDLHGNRGSTAQHRDDVLREDAVVPGEHRLDNRVPNPLAEGGDVRRCVNERSVDEEPHQRAPFGILT